VAGTGRDVFIVSRQLDKVMGQIHMQLSKAGPRQSQVCYVMEEALKILQSTDGKG
jgi:hypothetical protein